MLERFDVPPDRGRSALPAPSSPAALTGLLSAAAAGDRGAFDAAFASVYDELRRLAERVRSGRASDTLNATALVHEAYVKLLPAADGVVWEGRHHFFALAARAMRQVLVSAARERLAGKRGHGAALVTLDEHAHAAPVRPEQLVALDEALGRLRQLDARQADVVDQRIFAGLTAEETAVVLGVSAPTVQRDWRSARAWLARELDGFGVPRDPDVRPRRGARDAT